MIARAPKMLGSVKSVTAPAVVIRPIELPKLVVNHSAPSGPAVMPTGPTIFGSVKVVMTPAVVIRPIEPPPKLFVNQSAPSEPVTIPPGPWIVLTKFVTVPALPAVAVPADKPRLSRGAAGATPAIARTAPSPSCAPPPWPRPRGVAIRKRIPASHPPGGGTVLPAGATCPRADGPDRRCSLRVPATRSTRSSRALDNVPTLSETYKDGLRRPATTGPAADELRPNDDSSRAASHHRDAQSPAG